MCRLILYLSHRSLENADFDRCAVDEFASFLLKARNRLVRIAYASKCDLTGTDLQADVWIAAHEIAQRRGYEIDFADEADQELILSKVYSLARSQNDWRLRASLSIDAEYEGTLSWAERLPEKISTDPISILLGRELEVDQAKKLHASYSQAKAYIVVLDYLDNDRYRLCAYLVISLTTLRQRIARAIETALRQPSLFDGHEQIGNDFAPLAGREVLTYPRNVSTATQVEIQF